MTSFLRGRDEHQRRQVAAWMVPRRWQPPSFLWELRYSMQNELVFRLVAGGRIDMTDLWTFSRTLLQHMREWANCIRHGQLWSPTEYDPLQLGVGLQWYPAVVWRVRVSH